jgi:hypothetical protein
MTSPASAEPAPAGEALEATMDRAAAVLSDASSVA